jgi:tRNA(Ile)-lysidine synthetase-like protein
MIRFNSSYFPKTKFIFALSGGIDSIACCHFLKKKGFNFLAIHINHKFIEQDDDIAKGVKKFCVAHSIPHMIFSVNEKYEKGSKEDFCRKIRYKYLCDHAKLYLVDYIATAHHLDDCVESYFMNFLKGHPEYNPINFYCKYENATIFRPFLLNKKIDFIRYAKENRLIDYVKEDQLNSDLSLMRNWTRNEILPVINKRYKGLHKVVFKKIKAHLDEVVNH